MIAILPDGSILAHQWCQYLHQDGTPFPSNPYGETLADDLARGCPSIVVPMSDGGFVLADESLSRVRPDGSRYPGFQTMETYHAYALARKILAQGDKILILDHDGKLSRLKADGTPDPSFRMPVIKVYSD